MKQTIAQALRQAAANLQTDNPANARRDANLLLAFVLEKNLTYLIARDDDTLDDQTIRRFEQFVKRRAAGEPLQYILGRQEFFGLEFEVNENVLIPRPETELLVETALEILRDQELPTFCDVGTGSGCIAIAVAKNVENAGAVALDVSPNALQVARRNAERNNVTNQIQFLESDVFSVFNDSPFTIHRSPFSLVVSNPPYIPNADLPILQREVRQHEPHNALFAGADGLDVIRRLLTEAPAFLEKNGFLLFEIGFGQSGQIESLADKNVWKLREIRRDLQNIGRVVVLQKKC